MEWCIRYTVCYATPHPTDVRRREVIHSPRVTGGLHGSDHRTHLWISMGTGPKILKVYQQEKNRSLLRMSIIHTI